MSENDLGVLLEHLKASRGLDLSVYKPSTLGRRVERRMQAVGVPDVDAYVDHLEVDPDEMARLFDMVLINVTSFFRDEAAWRHLAEVVVPDILATRSPAAPIRAWSAGCATGEEAYTLAMILADALGDEEFCDRVKIYATDVDEPALAIARQGTYAAKRMEPVPAEMRERYFEPSDGSWTFRKDLRRSVIFGRHDLASDAPISRLDLLVCRNVLMYFNAEAQSRILERFDFGLLPTGTSSWARPRRCSRTPPSSSPRSCATASSARCPAPTARASRRSCATAHRSSPAPTRRRASSTRGPSSPRRWRRW